MGRIKSILMPLPAVAGSITAYVGNRVLKNKEPKGGQLNGSDAAIGGRLTFGKPTSIENP
jgi:hypothetical protein